MIFCITHVTIHFSQKRLAPDVNGSPDSHTLWRFYISLNTLSMIFLILFARNTTKGIDCYDCEIQAHVNVLSSHKRNVSLGVSLCYAIALKELEYS